MATNRAPNIKAMVARQTSPGSLVLILLACWAFLPRLWDTVWGEPWLEHHAETILATATGNFFVDEEVTTTSKVYGLQSVQVVNDAGDVLCATERFGIWEGQRRTLWLYSAYTGCSVPTEPFRVCSAYSLTSAVSDRRRQLGPFCTRSEHTSAELKT